MVSSVLGRLNFPFLISWVLLLSRTKTIEAFTNFKFEAKKLENFFRDSHFRSQDLCQAQSVRA